MARTKIWMKSFGLPTASLMQHWAFVLSLQPTSCRSSFFSSLANEGEGEESLTFAAGRGQVIKGLGEGASDMSLGEIAQMHHSADHAQQVATMPSTQKGATRVFSCAPLQRGRWLSIFWDPAWFRTCLRG
jgi:hypothetical protein